MRIRQTVFSVFAAIVLAIASGSACAAFYSSLIVFGDSLLDNGNAMLLNVADPGVGLTVLGRVLPNDPRQPAYPPGATKYTNPGGDVAVEVLAGRLGVPLAPSVAGGTNFAIGGATTGTLNLIGNAALVPAHRSTPDSPIKASRRRSPRSRPGSAARRRTRTRFTCFGVGRTTSS